VIFRIDWFLHYTYKQDYDGIDDIDESDDDATADDDGDDDGGGGV
jgi:hypothetical protein